MDRFAMKALCPDCGGVGCEKCAGTGYRGVGMKAGSMWARHCDACGEDNGARITDRGEKPTEKLGLCVFCKSGPVIWEYLFET